MSLILTPLIEEDAALASVVCSESLACSEGLGCSDVAIELALLAQATETFTLSPQDVQTLVPLSEIIRSSEFLHAGPNTFPSATTWPGQYGNITGHAFVVADEDVQTLAPLVEA